jgi:type VI secretion system secreted protein VgrG
LSSPTDVITWSLVAKDLGVELSILKGRGVEGMNRLSTWELDLLSADPLDPVAGLESVAALVIADTLEGLTRSIGLVVTAIAPLGSDREGFRTRVTLAPPHALLAQSAGYRIFQEKTAPEIVTEVLEGAGVGGAHLVFRLSGSYEKRMHCAQYAETDWAFIERLLADEGIAYWFDFADAGPTLVLGDGAGSHDALRVGADVLFDDPSGLVRPRSLTELELVREVATGSVHVRDYDVRHPDVLIESEAGQPGHGQLFEYPARVGTADAAKARAKVRLEQLERWKLHAVGKSDTARMQPGRVAKVVGVGDDAFDRSWLVVEVDHSFASPSRRGGDTGPHAGYSNRVRLAPGDATHRPGLVVHRPRVNGVETAITTGPGGEEIHVNDLSDLKVRFPWDRSGITTDKSSTWVRCMHMGMGGTLLIPRVGWEVPVAYLDGDPDRPIVLGRTYNGQGVVPYGLPGKKATSALQSATSPADGTTNEIRMGDDAGSMQLFVHATRDQTVVVGGGATTTVSVNETHDIGLSYTLQVDASQTATIGANQSVDVTTDYSTGVSGSRSETVAGLEHTKVTGNRTIGSKSSYTELVGALYGLQANQSNVDVKGMYTRLVGSAEAHVSGLGFSENVLGMRGVSVGGARIIVASKGVAESVRGAKTLTAGASSVKADGNVATKSPAAGKIKAATAKLQSGKELVIEAPTITIDVGGSLDAGAFVIGGGALKIKKGTTKIDGTITRNGGSKVGQ